MSSTSDSNSNPLIAFSQNLAEIAENVGNSLVAINGQRFPCSGIYWHEGLIVTSEENIKRSEGVTVILPDGETSPVTLLGRDRSTDIAIFKTETSLPIAPIDSDCELKVGHLAIAVGRDSEKGLFVAQGIISTVGDSWRSSLGGYIDRFIRLDINFYPGSGGSALVNAAGKVVGFNTTGPRRSVLTIPAATINRVIDRLLETGNINRGYLGLGMQPVYLPDSLVDELSLNHRQGLMVVNVEAQAPAEQAGIILGDILIAIEDTSIARLRDIQAYLEPQNIGKTLKIQLIRAGLLKDVSLIIGDSGRNK
ncbi:Trypsin-like serine protease with C-terminal PDZ domain [Hyella patelloides LEGE 07179]|uniref:Trypsin-like serine protease with C-terminal PDZ domain n=1 Tax=Hyella patelloides LEGE 07179 TaxID=945734 RepID=A0A563VMY2_9CYAN|nr:S1C family serine protease [Hyella patelloides]VEP12814.1 Trypsin-like serine protease with C-terminal PDZ domain [Hyella patelloides LEGE 07179]